jgi:hypothetical protein
MKAIAILILASLPVPQVSRPVTPPEPHYAQQQTAKASRKGGKWYLANTGHAVYCYGPVMILTTVKGEILHVATFCKGEKVIVPLKD